MHITAKILLVTATCLAATPALASEDEQAWGTVNVTVALPDNFKLSSETVFRTSDAKGFYEIEENVMVGYKLDKHYTVWLGYTHDPQYSHGDFTVMEHRFRQQFNFDNVGEIGKAKISGRIRLEERWREGQPGTAWRVQPAVKLSMPFVGKTTIAFQHESFIDLNTTTFQKVEGYERMRNSATVTIPLSKKIGIDVGYLNQHGFVPGKEDTSDHVFTAGIAASF